jgi:prevent-host-death family protein
MKGMSMTAISSRTFNQETGSAKKYAKKGPVFITDRGKPSYVLLSIADYERLTSKQPSFLDLISQGDEGDFEFKIPRLADPIAREFEFD